MANENEITRRSFLSRSAVVGGAAILGGTAATSLAGCSSSSSSTGTTAAGSTPGVGTGTPVKGGNLTVGTLDEIDGFYAASNHWDTSGFLYANAVFDPLVVVGADGSFQPYLCESVTPNAAFDVWTLTLRPGVKFHDGTALTSTVLMNNYKALIASPLTGQALKQVANVSAPNESTFVYNLTAPNPTFPFALTSQLGYPFAQAMIDNSTKGGVNKPIGTGPFMFSSWEPNSHFTAVRNPNYWRSGLPYLDSITFRPIPDTSQREASLTSGALDMIESSDPGTIKRFENQSQYQLVDSRTGVIGEPTMAFIVLNCAKAPTSDLTIRQALAKATDQATIQKIFGAGFGQPVNGPFLPGSPYYTDSGYPTYDPSGAKDLVNKWKAANGGKAPAVTLTTITDPRLAQVAQIIQQMWKQAGFEVAIQTIQQAQLVDNLVIGEFSAITAYQFGNVTPDLNYVWWSTTTVHPPGQISLNFPRNSDPVLESNMLTARSTTNTATRVAAYQTVDKQLAKDLPYLWLEQYLFSEVATMKVQNFNNLVLPNGQKGYSFDEGVFFPTQIWLNS